MSHVTTAKAKALIVAQWLIFGSLALVSAGAQASELLQRVESSSSAPKQVSKKTGHKALNKQTSVKKSSKKRVAGQPSATLSRDVVFDGSMINGKYLSAGDATTVVENEKQMGDLIGLRGNFNDRLQTQRSELTATQSASPVNGK